LPEIGIRVKKRNAKEDLFHNGNTFKQKKEEIFKKDELFQDLTYKKSISKSVNKSYF